jgi:anti-sigma regulatory factor (Ser/Thr protein kinase)
MQPDPTSAGTAGTRFAPERESAESELDALRATCRRQTLVIDKLSDTISALRSDTIALETENADLRDHNGRLRRQSARPGSADAGEHGEAIETSLPLDVEAPAAARFVVAGFLRSRVSPRLLDTAQLLISELVSSSLRHNAAPFDQSLVVRVGLEDGMWRLEVEDPGGPGVIAPDPPDHAERRGLGMNLVQRLSGCWGVEHAAEHGTRTWAYLPHQPVAAH